MGFDDQDMQPRMAADFNELRLRVERLERDLAELQRERGVTAPVAAPLPAAPPPPPPLQASVTRVTVEETQPIAARVVASSAPPPPKASLENRLGSQVFNWIGIIAIFIAAAWGLQLAIQNNWIGPLGRILIGLIAGAGIVIWSERFRRKNMKAFSYSLKAIGSGVLYLSLWAAFQIYHLMPASAALGAMILVTIWNAYMAWSQDAELLAAYALIGGFATPALLSTGGNHEVFFFTYLLAINVATLLLIRVKPWARLLLGTFPVTAFYYTAWYIDHFDSSELTVTSIFLLLFVLTFAAISAGPLRASAPTASSPKRSPLEAYIGGIFLPLANAAFVGLGFFALLQDSHHHATLPFLMVALAAAYLVLMRLPQTRVASAIHLSLAIVFLTIAVPLKASGHWLTVAWLVEGVALFWVSTRLASAPAAEDAAVEPLSLAPDTVLRWLSAAALLLGFVALFTGSFWFGSLSYVGLYGPNLMTALIGVAAFAAVAWLAFHARGKGAVASSHNFVVLSMLAINAIAVLLAAREIFFLRSYYDLPHRAFFNPDLVRALVGIAVLAGSVWVTLRLLRSGNHKQTWLQMTGASIIAINLIALLSGVREISAFWSYSADSPSGDLKQALAVSGFLMFYSAMLLAVGFWKRTAFIRWQGLILLVFTIGKTFLYDMSSLSQGYRVVSFLGLGVLLMAVSFAYQKDWLGLRDPGPKVATPAPAPETEK